MNKRILLVEDEVDIANLVELILVREGYDVIAHYNADDYQGNIAESKADMVILDLNIAGFDGKIICDYIKQHPVLKNMPIVLMSANINIYEIMEACGADDIIRKPFDRVTLLNMVKRYAQPWRI